MMQMQRDRMLYSLDWPLSAKREEERAKKEREREMGGGERARERERDREREREREKSNSNSKTLILKESSVRSIWTYLTASPCCTTNTNMHHYNYHKQIL